MRSVVVVVVPSVQKKASRAPSLEPAAACNRLALLRHGKKRRGLRVRRRPHGARRLDGGESDAVARRRDGRIAVRSESCHQRPRHSRVEGGIEAAVFREGVELDAVQAGRHRLPRLQKGSRARPRLARVRGGVDVPVRHDDEFRAVGGEGGVDGAVRVLGPRVRVGRGDGPRNPDVARNHDAGAILANDDELPAVAGDGHLLPIPRGGGGPATRPGRAGVRGDVNFSARVLGDEGDERPAVVGARHPEEVHRRAHGGPRRARVLGPPHRLRGLERRADGGDGEELRPVAGDGAGEPILHPRPGGGVGRGGPRLAPVGGHLHEPARGDHAQDRAVARHGEVGEESVVGVRADLRQRRVVGGDETRAARGGWREQQEERREEEGGEGRRPDGGRAGAKRIRASRPPPGERGARAGLGERWRTRGERRGTEARATEEWRARRGARRLVRSCRIRVISSKVSGSSPHVGAFNTSLHVWVNSLSQRSVMANLVVFSSPTFVRKSLIESLRVRFLRFSRARDGRHGF